MFSSKSQTLITGVYRTGTEFLTQLVNCHPRVSATMYSVNVPRFVQGRYDPIGVPDNYRRALADIDTRLGDRYQKGIDIGALAAQLDMGGEVTYARLYDVAMSALYVSGEIEHWAEKNQLLWREIPEFVKTMPNGKAVLVIRDPRSVLMSFKSYTYAPPPAYLGAVFNCLDAMQHAVRYVTELPADRFILLRYEDVAVDPQVAAEKVWQLIGVEGACNVRSQANWVDAYGKPWHANSSFHAQDDTKPFDVAGSINRWRGKISDFEMGFTEAICGDLMAHFGYEACAKPADWLAAFRAEIDDPMVRAYYDAWSETGTGIQAFPTDPLRPENWRND